MEWRIEYDPPRDLLLITVRGDIVVQALQQLAAEALEELARRGASAVLFDGREARPAMSTLEIYNWPMQLQQMGLSTSIKLAIVHSSDVAQARDFQFYEGASCLLGMTHVGFTDMDAALEWLARAKRGVGSAEPSPAAAPQPTPEK